MVTIEQITETLSSDREVLDGVDRQYTAISLLRERIPFSRVRSIVEAAGHDVIYLPDLEDVAPFVSEEDLLVLRDCSVLVDEEFDCLFMFV